MRPSQAEAKRDSLHHREFIGATAVCAAMMLSITVFCQGQSLPTTEPAAIASPTTQPSHAKLAATSEPTSLKQMTLDQLMNIQVTTVTREPEKISDSPSAVQVLTGEEIQRSGAVSLPEALRLAPNLQVAQVNAHDWGITARGFNGTEFGGAIANKLLVMIDGRSVYNPLYGGVTWDTQNVLLEDIDRIEVVSGPGTTVWGDNAVNGVINVVTKSARDTQGLYFNQDVGSFWQSYTALQYGGRIDDNLYYRVYGLGFSHGGTQTITGAAADDSWYMKQTGFRMDYYPNSDSTFTFQGDTYDGVEGETTTDSVSGGNLLARFTHTFSEKSDLTIQMYFNGDWRELSSPPFHDQARTFDLQAHHRFQLGDRQRITYGFDLRLAEVQNVNVPDLYFSPAEANLPLYGGFVQDQITLVPNRLDLYIGTKLEDNAYTGLEWDPSIRLAWKPADRQLVWAAVSRAVRTPTRFDADVGTPVSIPNHAFESEKVVAYELGYRFRPITPLSLSIATFFNHYTDLRSVDYYSSAPPPFIFTNSHAADTYGLELSGDLQIATWWHVRGGYTFLNEAIWDTAANVVAGSETFEMNDPSNQLVLQSMMDLPMHLQFDTVLRYVDALPQPAVPGYMSLDVRIAWHYKNVELAIVGQNLLDNWHSEFGGYQIPRSYYGSLTIRW